MDNLQRFATQIRNQQLFVLLVTGLTIIAGWWIGDEVLHIDPILLLALLFALAIGLSLIFAISGARYLSQPLRIVAQAVIHVAPDSANVPGPDVKSARLGAELVTNLVGHIYQLASVVEDVSGSGKKRELSADFVANNLPLPLMVLDKDQNILFANQNMLQYLKRSIDETVGQNVYSVLDLSFRSNQTFDKWLAEVKTGKAVATNYWDQVKLNLPGAKTSPQFDLAAYYNQNNPDGFETILTLFDHTIQYAQDDQALSFVALAVHELRTPVTLLRGYIEVFEEELGPTLDPQLADFMHKMDASAHQLTTFVNNILNVARIENDQLVLKLHKEEWGDIVRAAVADMSVRSNVEGIKLTADIANGLPPVGVDRVSIYEVICNLIDNAIKYSGDSKEIVIKTYVGADGLVETTVQDFGVGIATSVMPNLFEKFYRSHHNRDQIGGTGLGLFLCKTLVSAHGGNIWVKSKEGQGSIFGFTVKPYAQLAEEEKNGDNTDIVRGAHGWIKNHSLYRG